MTENFSYTMLKSKKPCNLNLVSTKQIEGGTINQAFQTKSNLYDFFENFLKIQYAHVIVVCLIMIVL